jgi:VanZ family protein
MRKRRVAYIGLIVLILATIVFIWSNSLQSIPESQTKSIDFLNKVKPLLGIFVGTGNVTDHLVRKLAHFTEFGALGCELALLLALRKRINWQSVINSAFFAMTVALTDETIQIFSGRGSQVQDVWLDFVGSCTGILFVFVVFGLIKVARNRKNNKQGI